MNSASKLKLDRARLKKLDRAIYKLKKQISSITKLKRSEFLGSRYKRFLFLKARRAGFSQNMHGDTLADASTTKGALWILSVQENILNRSLIRDPNRREIANNHRRLLESQDYNGETDFRKGLVEEFRSERLLKPDAMLNLSQAFEGTTHNLKNKTDSTNAHLETLVTDVEKIFDPQFSRRERYLQTVFIEVVFAGFMKNLSQLLVEESVSTLKSQFADTKRIIALRWQLGLFTAYVYEYTDFLRVAAGSTSAERLANYKYEAMEIFLRLSRFLQIAKNIPTQNSPESLSRLTQELAQENQRLRAFRPWVEKRTAWSMVPFASPRPRCEDLARKAAR